MKYTILALSLMVTLSALGCKSSKKAGAAGPSGASAAASTTLTLGSNDQMKFDKSELTAPAGKMVTLTLKHTGKMPKTAMGHNFVLLKKGVDVQKFGLAAASAKDTGYIPADKKGDVIAHTKVIGGGESVTITFKAPEPGTYDFICSFPGHFGVMKGKFIAK